MREYIIRRVLIAVVTFFLVSLIIFYIFNYDIRPAFYFSETVSQVERERILDDLGIDISPLIIKYFLWMGDFFTGNWGYSFYGDSHYK